MSFTGLLKRLAATILVPHCCVLCQALIRQDLVPVCDACRSRLRPIQGPLCVHCGDRVPGLLTREYGICRSCRQTPPEFDQAWSWGVYGGNLRKLIRHFKYGGGQWLSLPLAELLCEAFDRHYRARPDFLIPTPSHPRRVRARGFDGVRLLTRSVSKALQIPVLPAVQRTRHTAPLFGLNVEERRKTLDQVFGVDPDPRLDGATVILVDDIMTTGSTLGALARALRQQSGIVSVSGLVVARAIRHRSG